MSTDETTAEPAKKRNWLKLVGILIAIGLFIYGGKQVNLGQRLGDIQLWIDSLGAWGPSAFAGLYAVLTVFAVPGSILTLAAGAIFGLLKGVVIAFSGAFIGSIGAFLMARYIARGWVEKKISSDPRLTALDRALGDEGLKIMALLRLSPVFPFIFLNFALGLTRVKLRDYILSGFAMIPGTLLYVYYGYAIGDVAKLATGGATSAAGGWQNWAVKLFGLVATIAVTTVITLTARRAFKEATTDTKKTDAIEGATGE